jgi:multimeric flavodoxin WrbA
LKRIILIDGGPRKTFNTASLLRKFAEGALSVGDDVEVKTFRLYNLDYKGCMSCMACKVKDMHPMSVSSEMHSHLSSMK